MRAVLFTILVSMGLCCGGGEPQKVVVHEIRPQTQVVIFRDRKGQAHPIEAKIMRQKVLRALSKAKHIVYVEGSEEPSARLRVEAILEIDSDVREGRAVVAMRTERDPLPLSVTVAAQGRVASPEDETLLDRALADAARALDGQAKLRKASDRELLRSLEAPDDDVKMTAARLLAVRRTPGSSAPIAKLLQSPRTEVRDAAVGALIELRDPASVRAIIESAPSSDPEAQLRIVEAVGAIGGTEAAAYLELLASGSDEAEIREAATRARQHLP